MLAEAAKGRRLNATIKYHTAQLLSRGVSGAQMGTNYKSYLQALLPHQHVFALHLAHSTSLDTYHDFFI